MIKQSMTAYTPVQEEATKLAMKLHEWVKDGHIKNNRLKLTEINRSSFLLFEYYWTDFARGYHHAKWITPEMLCTNPTIADGISVDQAIQFVSFCKGLVSLDLLNK